MSEGKYWTITGASQRRIWEEYMKPDKNFEDKYWTLFGAIKKWIYMWNLKRKFRRALKNTKFIKPVLSKDPIMNYFARMQCEGAYKKDEPAVDMFRMGRQMIYWDEISELPHMEPVEDRRYFISWPGLGLELHEKNMAPRIELGKELQIDLEKARQMGFSLPWTHMYLDKDGNVVIKEIPAEDFFKDCNE